MHTVSQSVIIFQAEIQIRNCAITWYYKNCCVVTSPVNISLSCTKSITRNINYVTTTKSIHTMCSTNRKLQRKIWLHRFHRERQRYIYDVWSSFGIFSKAEFIASISVGYLRLILTHRENYTLLLSGKSKHISQLTFTLAWCEVVGKMWVDIVSYLKFVKRREWFMVVVRNPGPWKMLIHLSMYYIFAIALHNFIQVQILKSQFEILHL